jgi:hypothetical protein
MSFGQYHFNLVGKLITENFFLVIKNNNAYQMSTLTIKTVHYKMYMNTSAGSRNEKLVDEGIFQATFNLFYKKHSSFL